MNTEDKNNDLFGEENKTWLKLEWKVGQTFTPATPIDARDLFAGRDRQLRQLLGAVFQRGQHVVLYGERGVGKTSLANQIADGLEGIGKEILAPRFNCDGSDNFSGMWKKIFKDILLTKKTRKVGFDVGNGILETEESMVYAETLEEVVSPHDVRKALKELSAGILLIVIIDEFDRIEDGRVKNQFADTIKALSDFSVSATLVIVGVANTVNEVIQSHESIERSLVQINVPRMSEEELNQIIDKGIDILGMRIDPEAKQRIVRLSSGLPHYIHLLALHAAQSAIKHRTLDITLGHVQTAINSTIENAQQSIKELYYRATRSVRKESIFSSVLFACALATPDEYGYFFASDVREQMKKLKDREYGISYFSKQLHQLCEEGRGAVLSRRGEKHRTKYKFKNPLLQPYVIMCGQREPHKTLL